MSQTWRFVVFLTIVLGIWTIMHVYVTWRLLHTPVVKSHLSTRALIAVVGFLWASYPLSRLLDRLGVKYICRLLEYVGADWMGVLFLLMVAFLAVDVVSGFGRLLPSASGSLRTGAVVAAGMLSVVAVVQGTRRPVLTNYDITLDGLPADRDGLVLVHISDLHVGSLLGVRWLGNVVDRVEELKPDVIVVGGDLVDGDAREMEPLRPVLQRLRAPLGVWAVTGNHEYYAGVEHSLGVFGDAGFRVLRDQWREVVPGLVFAGVDDLTARRQFGVADDAVGHALSGRPAGATVFISHTPWKMDQAAASGVDLMLSGHTHDGQIWPFTYVVRSQYPLTGGLRQIGGMSLVVCRGTGTWGPRMRLWRPSEIVRITLHSSTRPSSSPANR
ncbi:MAG: metallophosphoesterase [Acidobacteriota bacterium]